MLFFVISCGVKAKSFATLDWTVAETLIALGEKPVAVGDVKSYQQWVGEPALPNDTLDLGVRMQPNPELILTLKQGDHDLHFINSSFYAQATATLEPFSSVTLVDFYTEGDAWQNIVNASRKVAFIADKQAEFEALMTSYWQKIDEIRPLVQPYLERPIALVQFIDTRHLRIYAANSPFGAVLSQLGFHNAWSGSQNAWGFETIDVTQLAKLAPNSRLVVVKPYPANIGSALRYNTLWQHLAMAKDPLILPAVWTFGGIPSAQRFAEMFANGLLHGGEQW
ncbi:ABC-type Fe3+-hydroxamate transport system, periplasmic component; FhuD [Actinobacillus pleuropneumoniae serovar 5b str. L20]|uniref:ABC-type Fe3+-hydroxamate transport system, periplasmic component FhuD n=1 Tax=Actinobacillus pleuropneumoniae serotype 5b (strain L20) TaxID=416269 RepID=A3N3V2_ACTP2|nr:ABC-type Fe3+-hydroxamate transport system, periplasmic component; FhuD [Actinobacillus pleuropneumoniae serovar 5b str. L20]